MTTNRTWYRVEPFEITARERGAVNRLLQDKIVAGDTSLVRGVLLRMRVKLVKKPKDPYEQG